jgi:hypothetical protein
VKYKEFLRKALAAGFRPAVAPSIDGPPGDRADWWVSREVPWLAGPVFIGLLDEEPPARFYVFGPKSRHSYNPAWPDAVHQGTSTWITLRSEVCRPLSVTVGCHLRADGQEVCALTVSHHQVGEWRDGAWRTDLKRKVELRVETQVEDARVRAALFAAAREEEGAEQAAWDLAQDTLPWLAAYMELVRKTESYA